MRLLVQPYESCQKNLSKHGIFSLILMIYYVIGQKAYLIVLFCVLMPNYYTYTEYLFAHDKSRIRKMQSGERIMRISLSALGTWKLYVRPESYFWYKVASTCDLVPLPQVWNCYLWFFANTYLEGWGWEGGGSQALCSMTLLVWYESNTPVVLQAVQPAVIGAGRNAPVLQLPSEVCLRPCVVVGPVLKIKTSFRGFEAKRNPGYRKCTGIW